MTLPRKRHQDGGLSSGHADDIIEIFVSVKKKARLHKNIKDAPIKSFISL